MVETMLYCWLLCHELKLAIEADGGVHEHPEVSIDDWERQEEIESYGMQGYRVGFRRYSACN
jgi:very-short-patch-repair endonuclease